MNDQSFMRVGGLAGILLAVTSWVAVVVYFVLVPAAQQLPVADLDAYLASLAADSTGTLLFNGLQSLVALWSLIGTAAVYYRLRETSERWAFFGTVTGMIAAVAWILFGLQAVSALQYIAALQSAGNSDMAQLLYNAPSPVNPFQLATTALPAIWFLVISLLMLQTNLPKLLAYLGLIAFADLTVGFLANLAGIGTLPTITALIAGAVGGPIFWLWLGWLLWREQQA